VARRREERSTGHRVSEFAFAPGAATPRKRPTQERSQHTVAAILEACVRVLDRDGDALTTTRVAELAGVSVGTLYQYFPNREALINGVLAEHVEHAICAIEAAAVAAHGLPLEQAADRIARAFLAANADFAHTSSVLHRVLGLIDDRPIVRAATRRAERAVATLLPGPDAARRAAVLCAALEGIVRSAIYDDPTRLADPIWIEQVVALAVAAARAG
jgi:AcrR family transcriptional regulator